MTVLSGLFSRALPSLLALLVAASGAGQAREAGDEGIIVSSVGVGYSGAAAGIQVGDVLREYRHGDDWHPIVTPFEFAEIAVDPGQRGALELRGGRGGETRRWIMAPGFWVVSVRPHLSAAELDRYQAAVEGFAALEDDAPVDGPLRGLENLATDLSAQGRGEASRWVIARLSSLLRSQGKGAAGDARSRALATRYREADQLHIAAHLLETAGREHGRRGEMMPAVELIEEGLALRRQAGGRPLHEAAALRSLGIGYSALDDLPGAIERTTRSIEILRHEVPDSLELAESLHTRGNAYFWSGNLESAEQDYVEMTAIRRALAPDSVYLARSLAVLGNVYWRRGDLDGAQAHYRESHALYEQTGAAPQFLAQNLLSQGFIAHDRRDLALAEDFYQQALTLLREHDPGGDAEASALLALGNTARVRHDLDEAEDFYTRALALFQAISPDSQRVALVQFNRAQVARQRGDLAAAETLLRASLDTLERADPDGVLVPDRFLALSELALERGEFAGAVDLAKQALERYREIRSGGINEALALHGLARIDYARQRYEASLSLANQSLEIFRAEVPGSVRVAHSAHLKALNHWRLDQTEAAEAAFVLALSALDAQRARLGGDAESRSAFSVANAHIYRDYAAFLLQRGEARSAVEVVWNYRRAQIDQLLDQAGLLRSGALDRDGRATLAGLRYQYQKQYESLLDARAEEYPRIKVALAELRGRIASLVEAGNGGMPGVAPDVMPEPVSGQAWLTWLVRADESYALWSDGTQLFYRRLDLDPESLEADISRLRTLVQLPAAPEASRRALTATGARLYRQLVGSVEPALAELEHLTLLPDDALWRIPFTALVSSVDGDVPRYWIEDLALSVAPLMPTAEPRSAAMRRLLALADPEAPEGSDAPRWRDRRRSQGGLPHAAVEATSIANFFDSAEVLVGAAASERRVKAAGTVQSVGGEGGLASGDSGVDVLHFATHGLLDPWRGMDSYLMLSPDGGAENGFLHAWEVHEQLRIDADLVALSACDTAAGAGRGLFGLSWAFHAAGADSVLATLWPVEDRSTSELMMVFYRRLNAGLPVPAALRDAQLDLLRTGGRHAHPFYWAGFQLSRFDRPEATSVAR